MSNTYSDAEYLLVKTYDKARGETMKVNIDALKEVHPVLLEGRKIRQGSKFVELSRTEMQSVLGIIHREGE